MIQAVRLVAAMMLALLVACPMAVHAVQPDEVLSDPALEQRARNLSLGLRCLVCQNQSIDDSDAPLARDLRVLVRERLKAGDSDEEVIDFVVARYGEFVLLKPRVKPSTWALWFAPAIILLLGLFALVLAYRRRQSEAAARVDPLSSEEKRALNEALERR